MDHAAGEVAKGRLYVGGDLADGLAYGRSARRARPLDGISGQIVGAVQAEVREVMRVVGVQVVDLHEADCGHVSGSAGSRLKGRVVHLHITGQANGASRLPSGNDPVGLLQREADRLFDKDVFASLKGGHGDFGFGIGVAQEHRVEIRGEQRAPVVGVVWHVKLLRHGLRQGRREVADHLDEKQVLERGEVGQVLDLGDGPAADDADADRIFHKRCTTVEWKGVLGAQYGEK